MDLFNVEVIWRYAQGHRGTAIHTCKVRSTSPEAAEKWGAESLRRKIHGHEIEVIKVTAQYNDGLG